MDVSTVVVNWNTCDILRNCLASLYANTRDVEVEVIVIDNASSDGSVDMVKSEFPLVKIIANAENRGFAAGNNQGIAIAKGRYILLLNSDTVVLNNAITETVAFADAYPEAAVVGCRVLNPDRTLQPTCFMFPSILNMILSTTYLYKLFHRSCFFGRERMTWWDKDNVREVDVVTGCFMLVRRQAVDHVGLMDERFFVYGEETDWCYRFKQAGWKVMFTPCAEIIHVGGGSSKQMKPEMVLQLRASILFFFKKHRGRLAYRLACLLVASFFFFRTFFWLVSAVFSGSTRRSCLATANTYAAGASKAIFGWRALAFQKQRLGTNS